MSKLSEIWDGEEHQLTPDEHFPAEGCVLVLDGWDEADDDDLQPFESNLGEPILRDTGTPKGADDPRFPLRRLEQSWGALSVVLGAFAAIVGVERRQYQQIDHHNKEVAWTFRTTEPFEERI